MVVLAIELMRGRSFRKAKTTSEPAPRFRDRSKREKAHDFRKILSDHGEGSLRYFLGGIVLFVVAVFIVAIFMQ